jgi:glycosyltransferase involved in cell wall biosynthesis
MGDGLSEHLGMKLVYLPTIRLKSADTLIHAILSAVHVGVTRPDGIVLMNVANVPALALIRLFGLKAALHVDGLESRRAKWGTLGRRYFRVCEALAPRLTPDLIADAVGIQAYYRDERGAESVYIPYGVPTSVASVADVRLLTDVGVKSRAYHLCVARFEPENQVLEIVEAFARSSARHPLLVVGGAPYSKQYTARIESAAAADDRVRLLGPIWDQQLLSTLYSHALSYIHGHSVGGTNPSLLAALGQGAPVIAFDVIFNREVAQGHATYFASRDDIASLVEEIEGDPASAIDRAERARRDVSNRYDWDRVADAYEELLCKLR